MEIKKAVLDELIKDYKKPEDLIGETRLLKQLTKALLERALSAELVQYLGYERHDPAGYHSGNSRNSSRPGPCAPVFRVSIREWRRGGRFWGKSLWGLKRKVDFVWRQLLDSMSNPLDRCFMGPPSTHGSGKNDA